MIGVSNDVIAIQSEFLDFEVKYKTTQNIFTEVYKLTKAVKRSKMYDINEKTYKIAEMFVEISEQYILTKTKIQDVEADYSLLDTYVKQVVLTMLEDNRALLTDIELNLKILLDLLVNESIIPKKKINNIIKSEEKAKNSVIFVSKYETIYPSNDSNFALEWLIRNYLYKFIITIPMLLFIISDGALKLKDFLFGFLLDMENSSLEAQIATGNIYPDLEVMALAEPLLIVVNNIAKILCFISLNILFFKFILDMLYISVPASRPYLSIFFGNRLGLLDGLLDDDLIDAVQIEKFKLVRAKEIISAIRGIPEYSNSTVIIYLDARLKSKNTEDVLTLEDNYSILLAENIYDLINVNYASNKKLIDYSLGITTDLKATFNPTVLKIMVLKQRLGFNQ